MRRILLFVTSVLLSQTLWAQAQVDLKVERLIKEARSLRNMSRAGVTAAAADTIHLVGQIDAAAAEKFMAHGEGYDFARITAYAGGVAVVKVALPDVERLRYTAGVTSLEYPYPVKLNMDKARPYCGVGQVQSGAGLPGGTGISGKGVSVIIVDSGLDYNHPAFRDHEGNTRIKLLALRDQWGNFYEVSDPQEIARLTSDDSEVSHATHVMSMAAGTETGNGYGGVAQEADLVFVQTYYKKQPEQSEGIFNFVNTDVAWELEAAQKAHEIAKRLGSPSVINMSLGNEIGARDGSDLAAQFMRELSRDAIYCLSAGNSGFFKEHVHHTFAQDGETAKISLESRQYSGVQFFSDNDKPFTLKFRAAGDGIVPVTLASIREAGILVIDSENADDPLVQKVKPYISTENFRIEMRAGKYYNGKYFAEVFATNCRIDSDFSNFQLEIAADKDTHIDGHIFMMMGVFSTAGKPGEMTPDDNGSINAFVPGTNIICVGAMAARATVPLTDGKEVDCGGYKAQTDDMAPFSGWMSYPDGGSLPHVVAPGYNVVAAGNMYYSQGFADNSVRIDEKFGRKCHYVAYSGTSMAAPFVTGVVALWLQANPDLTAADVRAIMKKTAKTTAFMEQCSEPARWGWGVVDAYSGIKEAFAMPTTIADAAKASPQFVRVAGSTLEVLTAGRADAALYNLSGARIASAANGSIDISSVPHGVYLLRVSGSKAVKITL